MKIILSFLFIAFGFTLLLGQVSYNTEFQVNTYSLDTQENPDVCNLINGGFVICWQSYGQDGSGYGIFGQIYNMDGSKRSTEFQINTYIVGNQKKPSIGNLSDGGFQVCWESDRQDGSKNGIFGQIYNSDGAKRSGEFQVNTYTDSEQVLAITSGLSKGGFVICWNSYQQDGSAYGVFGQIYNNDGSKRGTEFRVNTLTISNQRYPSVSCFLDGGFVVCWSGLGQYGLYGIYGQIFNGDGSKRGDEFKISTNLNSDQEFPNVDYINDNRFVICWEGWFPYEYSRDIRGQIYSTNGVKQGDEFQVNNYFYGEQRYPRVRCLLNNRFIICWESFGQDKNGHYGITGQVYNNNGSRYGSEFQINTDTDSYANLNVSSSFDGVLVVCWQSYGKVGSDWDIFAKYYENEITHPLRSFSLINPSIDETLKVLEHDFNWQQASDIRINLPYEIEYTLYLDKDDNFSRPRIIPAIYDTTCVVDSLVPGTTYFWKVLAKNIAGDSLWSSETNAFFVSHDAVSAVEKENREIPESFELFQNFPNPFNPQTTIKYALPSAHEVQVKIYNALGQLVEVLVDARQTSGLYKVKWNANNNPSGVYFCVVQAGSFKAVQKMLLIK